ncbi:MAG: transposase [Candidatus Humimicrobiaceae bacterium]
MFHKLDQAENKDNNSKYIGSHYSGDKIDKIKIGRRRIARNAFNIKKRSIILPDSTLFYRPGAGRSLSYKVHIASDTNGFITAVSASPSSLHDTGAVPELIESHEKILGAVEWIAADKKYGSEECLRYLQEKGIKTAVKPKTKNNKPEYFSKEEFRYDKNKDIYICPNSKTLKRKTKNNKLNRVKYCADINDCMKCSLKDKCLTPNTKDFRFITKYNSNAYDKATATTFQITVEFCKN